MKEGLQRGGEGKQSGLGMAWTLTAHTVACCPCLGDTLTHAPLPVLQGTHCGGGGEGGEPQPWNPQPLTSGKRRFEGGPLPGSPRKCRKQSHGGCKESKPPSESQL